ncbi:MAG TPA: hypothetical protein VMU17_07980, partial [Elusimicrobiota bacterium]|nr:hypothetical protein [Elusimicrobiota bacterium]
MTTRTIPARHSPRGALIVASVILVWGLLTSRFILKNPLNDLFIHDYGGHLEYSEILGIQKRFPKPLEGWETYQPPLYYLVTSRLMPNQLRIHVLLVRMLSVLLGMIAMVLLAITLSELRYAAWIQAVVLAFLGTTPGFFFIFQSYNNDTLSSVLSLAILVCAFKLSQDWRSPLAIAYTAACALGLYTKYSVGMTIICLVPVMGWLAWRHASYRRFIVKLAGLTVVGCLA